MYYIYHIEGIKIGCTKQPEIRVKEQGYKEFEILETHSDIKIASKRERELQKEYGYRVDNINYSQTINNQSLQGSIKGGKIAGNLNKENGHIQTLHLKAGNLGGKAAHKKHPKLFSELGKKLGKIQANKNYICPHCGKEGKTSGMYTWHFDNCLKNPNGPKKTRKEIRNTKGIKNNNSKLTQEQVDEIRNIFIHRDKNYGVTSLSRKYNVSHNTISRIVRNITY